MEYKPSQTMAYLAGKVDEYVKFQGRDTIKRNAKHDRNCRYARIPDGGACDFCRMLGSRGFVYHTEESAGGVNHGTKFDTYHPYCNCQIAVCFDPFIDEYYVGWTKVTRGYGDGQVTVTGRDKSDVLRQVDIDELYDEYKRMAKDFNKGGKASKYKDYTKATKLSDEDFDEYMKRLSDAESLDELYDVAKEIARQWPDEGNGRDKVQWEEMKRHAKALERSMKEMEIGRAAKSLDDWGGSFGSSLDSVRKEYRESEDVCALFNEKWGMSIEFGNEIGDLPSDKRAALMAGLDKGMEIVGDQARKIAFVEIRSFDDEETLGMTTRREGDVGIIRLSPKVFDDKTLDQIEQITFHEVAHTAEWRFTSYEEWSAEQDALLAWRGEEDGYLEMSTTSRMLAEVFDEQGISYEYRGEYGIILFTGDDLLVALEISDYAASNADAGMQDSELIAESIRYRAVYPHGKNKVAISIVKKYL